MEIFYDSSTVGYSSSTGGYTGFYWIKVKYGFIGTHLKRTTRYTRKAQFYGVLVLWFRTQRLKTGRTDY